MSKIVQSCPLCGSPRSKFFEKCMFRDREVVNRVCLNCGLVFQSPCMDDSEAAAFYAAEYRLLNDGSIAPTARNMSVQHARAESLGRFIKPFIRQPVRHLDIGCSTGILLGHFEKVFHCQPTGIEPGEAHREYAHKNGLAVYASLEELEKDEPSRFGLISMVHVLEHLPDPVGYLTHLRKMLLDPAGWLLLEVPNLYAHDSFETAHLIAYSPYTLRQTLAKAGFGVIQLKKHGRPRSACLPLYITAMAFPKSNVRKAFRLHSERFVAIKRRVGMTRRRILERLFPRLAWFPDGE